MSDKNTVIILGGGLMREKKGRWRTTNFDEGDNFGISGDRIRVVAAGYLYQDNKDILFLVCGGRGQLEKIPNAPTISSIIKKELIKLGVPAEKIIKEEKSGNTYQQLKEANKIIAKGDFKKILIISNKCHLPRVSAMINYNKEFDDFKKMVNNKQILLKSAEEIVIKHKPKIWRSIIKSAYASKEMKERIALEKKGIREIKNNTYKFK